LCSRNRCWVGCVTSTFCWTRAFDSVVAHHRDSAGKRNFRLVFRVGEATPRSSGDCSRCMASAATWDAVVKAGLRLRHFDVAITQKNFRLLYLRSDNVNKLRLPRQRHALSNGSYSQRRNCATSWFKNRKTYRFHSCHPAHPGGHVAHASRCANGLKDGSSRHVERGIPIRVFPDDILQLMIRHRLEDRHARSPDPKRAARADFHD
jgi:hypothetical protein